MLKTEINMKLALEKLVAEQITWEKKRALCNTRELKEKNNILHSVEKKTTSRPHAYGKILEVFILHIYCPIVLRFSFIFGKLSAHTQKV